jgi:midasin (ATPase involved in ribosome maturation)
VIGGSQSGKKSLIKVILNDNKQSFVVDVDETTDVKQLVGSYICDDMGEFVFQKGPLSQAAMNGGVLVINSIDKCATDIATFLLPLI